MSDEADGGPGSPGAPDESSFDQIEQEGLAQQQIQRALGYDWGGFDLASPWDTGHEIVAIGRPGLPPTAAALVAESEPGGLPGLSQLLTPQRIAEHGRRRVEHVAHTVLEEAGEAIEGGRPMDRRWVELTLDDRLRQRVRAVINATGSLLPPSLGGAPWCESAITAARRAAGYTDVDFDVARASWGARGAGLEGRLCALTGAEAALAVGSHAGAVLLALSALAGAGDMVVSRGDLVELPDGRRVVDLLRLAGVHPLPVGSVNRTAVEDVLAPLDRVLDDGPPVAGIFCVLHPLRGQVLDAPPITQLARQGVPLIVDHAIGAIDDDPLGRDTVVDAIAAGAEVVCFAGDGPLGGPQSGIVVGQRALIERLRAHPLYRILQLDKTLVAALEATVDDRLRGLVGPVEVMSAHAIDDLRVAVEHWQAVLGGRIDCRIVDVQPGDGRDPDDRPSVALAIYGPDPHALAVALARGEPAVMGRFLDGALMLDARTVVPLERAGRLLGALERAIEAVLGF